MKIKKGAVAVAAIAITVAPVALGVATGNDRIDQAIGNGAVALILVAAAKVAGVLDD